MKKILLLLCLLTVTLHGQVRRDSASRIRFGDTLPATCNPGIGQVFFIVDPGSPLGLHQCLATDTWTLTSGTVMSGANTEVGVFDGPASITGHPELTFDPATEVLALVDDSGSIHFGASSDAQIHRDGAGELAMRRGTGSNANWWYVYDHFNDSSNYDRLAMYSGGPPPKVFELEVQTAGTGDDDIDLKLTSAGTGSFIELDTGGGTQWRMQNSIIRYTPTNTIDLGASGSVQPRNGWFSGLLTAGTGNVSTALEAILIDRPDAASSTFLDSHFFEMVGAANDGSQHDAAWRIFVDVTDTAGASTWTLQHALDPGAYTTKMTVSDSSSVLGLPEDVASFQMGAALDAQMHRGDGADIIEQRRGTNPQEWRLYERFVSHSDYDRLTFYIGGGPPLLTAEIEAQSTVAGQGINLLLEAQDSANGGSVTLQSGNNRLVLGGSSSSTTVQMFPDNGLTLNGFRNAFFGGRIELGEFESAIVTAIDIDIDPGAIVGMGTVDSHSINIIGRADDGSEHTAEWKTFVDVTSTTGESIFTIQERIDAAAFVNAFEITNTTGPGGKVTFPQVGEHSIGTALDDANQLTLGGDYFALDTGGTVSKFKVENRITAPTGTTTGLFLLNIDGTLRTQTATESIADVAVLNLERPVITDNLTGGGVITEASILRIENDPVEGVSNFSILVEGGLSEFRGNLQMGGSDRAAIVNEVPSTTNPVLLPDQTNLTSGIGGINGDVSFIANATNLITGDSTGLGFFGVTPAVQPAAYTRNATVVEDRTLLASASATATNNNNVLAALIADLQSLGLIQ